MRLVLTAGYDRALHAVALAELVRRDGHELAAILVVSPFNLARARVLVRQRGRRFLWQAARRLAGLGPAGGRPRAAPDPLERLLAEEGIEHRSLRAWAREHRVPIRAVSSLNSKEAVAAVSRARAGGTLYGGGGILGARFLEACGGRVLNAHSGPLPAVRGMNACEWSILLGHRPAVTIHVIDRGIDTGGVVEEIPLPTAAGDDLATLRARCVALGVQGLRRAVASLSAPPPPPRADAAASRQCFVLAPALRELLEATLEERLRALAPARSAPSVAAPDLELCTPCPKSPGAGERERPVAARRAG